MRDGLELRIPRHTESERKLLFYEPIKGVPSRTPQKTSMTLLKIDKENFD
jgi:hypothetical protein